VELLDQARTAGLVVLEGSSSGYNHIVNKARDFHEMYITRVEPLEGADSAVSAHPWAF
jgi:hypothetical protein